MKSILLLLAVSFPAFAAPNALSPEEKREGFKLLFDGKSLKGWRTYKEKEPKEQWKVEDGAITLTSGGGGDLVTDNEFSDFDFRCEWKIADQGNSGIMWRSTEDHQYPWVSGPEYQILDSFDREGHKYSHETKKGNIAGCFYDIIPGKVEWSKPVGEWNETRIVVKGSKITLYPTATSPRTWIAARTSSRPCWRSPSSTAGNTSTRPRKATSSSRTTATRLPSAASA